MEPNNKLENQFRAQLNDREIAPTPRAWDRLDAMLTVAENKKPKQKFNWLLIAASFVGILFVGIVIYQLNATEVVSKNDVVANKKPTVNQKNNILKQNENQVAEQTILLLSNNNQKQSNQPIIINQKTNRNSIEKQIMVVDASQNSKKEVLQKTEITEEKIADNSNQTTVVEELKSNQNSVPKPIKVDANSLLSQVNGELNQEFRETKFQKLKRNIQSVKVAMDSRNNQ